MVAAKSGDKLSLGGNYSSLCGRFVWIVNLLAFFLFQCIKENKLLHIKLYTMAIVMVK